MTNAQFIHKWVHLDANDTKQMRTKQYGNLSFSEDGKTLFSYGWYPIGYKYTDEIIFTRQGNYSNSTARHNDDLRSAISHLTNIAILDSHWGATSQYDSHWGQYGYQYKNMTMVQFKELADHYSFAIYQNNDKKLVNDWYGYEDELTKVINTFDIKPQGAIKAYLNQETTTLFRLWKDTQNEAFDKAEIRKAKADEKRAIQNEIRRKEWAKADELRKIENAKTQDEKLAEWREGKRSQLGYSFGYDKTYLRVKGDNLQTSKGMSIDISHAKTVLRDLMTQTRVNGHKVGSDIFTTDGTKWLIYFDGVHLEAGCHKIELSEATQFLSNDRMDKELYIKK